MEPLGLVIASVALLLYRTVHSILVSSISKKCNEKSAEEQAWDGYLALSRQAMSDWDAEFVRQGGRFPLSETQQRIHDSLGQALDRGRQQQMMALMQNQPPNLEALMQQQFNMDAEVRRQLMMTQQMTGQMNRRADYLSQLLGQLGGFRH
jgi:hypothetical protein